MHWREQTYGRIKGGDIEKYILMFREIWAERITWSSVNESEDAWVEALQKLMPVANWTPYYQLSLIELVARIAVISGVAEELVAAAESDNPAEKILRMVDSIPASAPDHPEAIPLAFAMIGNLDAIALYSRSINDMVRACKEGHVEALFQALSVDSYVSTMPFFQSAMRLGQLSGDGSVTEEIFKAIKGPHKRRAEFPELRWVEYLLRDQDAFGCSKEVIYELVVEHLGLYDQKGEKRDAKSGLFKLFRTWQLEAGIQKPRFGFSATK